MASPIVQSATAQSVNAMVALNVPFDQPTIAKDTIVVVIAGYGDLPNSVGDSNGNTYVLAVSCPPLGTDQSAVYIWWAQDVAGGATVQISAPGGATGAYTGSVYEPPGAWE